MKPCGRDAASTMQGQHPWPGRQVCCVCCCRQPAVAEAELSGSTTPHHTCTDASTRAQTHAFTHGSTNIVCHACLVGLQTWVPGCQRPGAGSNRTLCTRYTTVGTTVMDTTCHIWHECAADCIVAHISIGSQAQEVCAPASNVERSASSQQPTNGRTTPGT